MNQRGNVVNLSMRQLRAFVEVATLGSFTRAAERVHVTQAGLSAMIRELESQVGERLFERTTRSVRPTEAGRVFLPSAIRVLDEIDRARERLAHAVDASHVRVAVTSMIAAHLLPAVLARVRASRPELSIGIVDAGPQEMLSMVERDDVDCALGAFLRPAAGIERVALFRFGLALVSASPPGGRRKASPVRSPWLRLRDEPLVALAADNLLQQRIEALLARRGIEPEIVARFNTLETVLAMSAAGVGSAIVPTFTLPACERLALRIDALRAPGSDLEFYRISRKGVAIAPGVGVLTDLLREAVGGNDARAPSVGLQSAASRAHTET